MDKKLNTLALALGTGVAFAVTLLPLLGLPATAGPRNKPSPSPTPTVSATPTAGATPTATTTSSPTASATPTTTQGSPVAKGLNLSITITPWNGGATADVTVMNSTGAPISGWMVDVPWQIAPTSIWSGVSTSTPGHVIVSQEAWNGSLAAGATTSFGMTYLYSSPPANPTSCTATATALATDCGIASVTWTPVTATTSPSATVPVIATATTSSTPTTPATIPPAVGVANYKLAPYIDMAAYPTPDLAATRTSSGQNVYSLGFVTAAAACQPAWGGYPTLAVGATGGQIGSIDASVGGVRSVGGDVIVSFGGAAGTELARTCTDVTLLKNAYRAVVDRYALRAIDLDIEGAAQSDHAANVRRSQALAALQGDLAAAGRTLRISLTLPVLPTGLTSTGLGVVQDTMTGKARIDLVNVMAMDYGGSNSAMGQAAINAGTATAKQMSVMWPSLTDVQRLANIGVTPMIGQNDIANEVFTVADATALTTWARNRGLGQISWWQVLRDTPCAGNALVLSTTCSGTTAPTWTYSSAFLKR